MSLKAKVYIGSILAIGCIILAQDLGGWSPQRPVSFLCYLVFASWASCLKVRLPGVTGTMSVMFIFLLAGIAQLGVGETLIIGTICVLVQSYWRAKARPKIIQPLFSIANITIAIWAADILYTACAGSASGLLVPFRLVIAGAVLFFANTFPIAVVIALTEHKPLSQVWSHCYWWSFPYYLIGAAMVSMFTLGGTLLNWQAWLLIVPVIYVIYRSYHLYLDQLETERQRAEDERKHAEEVALLHSRALDALALATDANTKLDAVIQASPLAIVGLDLERKVATWSTAAERIFGWRAEEVKGKRLPFTDPKCVEAIDEAIGRTRHGDLISGLEMKQMRKGGSPFDAAIWSAPLRVGGQGITGVLIVIADASDRKRLEEQLHLAQKMEAVGRLAGGVAHDFNNLLTVINGYSAMLMDELKSDPYACSEAEQILGAGTRAADLVSRLLAFSRRQMIKPTPLDINELIQGVERMLRRVVSEHIEIRTVLDPKAGWIEADRNQMESVLLNLATNAQDAMPRGGVLLIETAPLDVATGCQSPLPDLAAGSYVSLMVRDSGQGMDAETLQHAFEPFFTTKEKGKGTGLGLSSVYGAVTQNRGRIAVLSEVGEGTTFRIYLPRIEAPSAADVCPSRFRLSQKGTETILLVEDENSLRRMLREALSKSGFRVLEAENGSDAINKWAVELERIDLLVTDIVMPIMNGLKLAQELDKRRPGMKVIFMSGHAEEMISKQSGTAAAMDLLTKPFLPNVLVQRVLDVLHQGAVQENATPAYVR